MKQLNFQGMIKSFKENDNSSFIRNERDRRRSMQYDKILDCFGHKISEIDFNSFSLKDIEQLIYELQSFKSADEFLLKKEFLDQNHDNYFFRNERVAYAIFRLKNNRTKQYTFTDDFI